MLSLVKNTKNRLLRAYRTKIREAAISRTKSKIALQGKTIDDFTEDQIRDIVSEEERDLVGELKSKSLVALAAALGFGVI